MKTKHTPGPWHLKRSTEFRDGEIKDYAWVGFGPVGDETPVLARSHADNEANARLIAAAPEMLEMLQFIDRRLDLLREEVGGGENPMVLGAVHPEIKALIAKATSGAE